MNELVNVLIAGSKSSYNFKGTPNGNFMSYYGKIHTCFELFTLCVYLNNGNCFFTNCPRG
jgi:hypothetical protein